MKSPIKIIHKYKNNNRRIQYKIYIFIGSNVEENVLKILNLIKNKDFLTTLSLLSNKQIKDLENAYGIKWYESFFTSYHINFQLNILKNNNLKRKMLETKMTKEWVKMLLDEPVLKKLSYSFASSYYNILLMKNKIKSLTRKNEMDFRTYNIDKKLLTNQPTQPIDLPMYDQDGGYDDDESNISLDSETDVDEDIDIDVDENESEKVLSEDDINEEIEEEFNLEELTKLYVSQDIESNKTIKETSKLISEAIHDDKWMKNNTNVSLDYDDEFDNLTYDSKIEDIYVKYYITNQFIFKDDTIKILRNKISVSVPLNPKFGENIKLLPECMYFWSEYTFEGKNEQVMLGQKWIRRYELLKIDIKPNENLKAYEKLRNNLAYLKDSFGYKIKREDDETNIINHYQDFITSNEIFMLDIYNEFGINYNPESENKKNLYEVYINIYFPGISYERMDQILSLLNGKDNKETLYIDNAFGTIVNDIKLETEIYQIVEKSKDELSNYEKYFFKNYIIQSIIHVNLYDPKNITGTVSDVKLNLYRIFDNFVVGKDYPFIQYQTQDTNIIYKFYSKTEKIDNNEIMSKWFENAPYGISVKIKFGDNIISINIHESCRIEYKITFKEEQEATLEDINKTYDIVRDLLKKINSENKKIKFILPLNDRFKFAFINTIQKFTIPEKFKINHNDLSDFARFFFPYISLVIEPKKRESKKNAIDNKTSKYGTYLRYKRISKYENRTKMHLRILYFLRNYDLSDKELIDEIAKQFNIIQEVSAKEIDYVREKYIKIIKKSRNSLKKFTTLPKSKPPGIDISIQGRDREKYKIRITGARDNSQLDEIISFMKVLIFLYCETYLYKKKEYQKLKETLKKLTKIAVRRNKVIEYIEEQTPIKNVKIITALDKSRLGYKPEEGQNQWTRNCQNSGDDKKRRPDIIPGDQIEKLINAGYKLNDKNGYYERTVELKNKGKVQTITIRAIKLSDESGKYNFFTCNPDENNEHHYVGFLTKGNNPNDLCMPCCFKKDQLVSNNAFKMSYYKKCIGEKSSNVVKNVTQTIDKIYILQETNKIQDGRFILLSKYLDIFFNKLWDNDYKIKNHYLIQSNTGYFFKYTIKNDKYNFLATIADIYQKTIPQLIEIMIKFIKNDKNENFFLYLNNGDIRETFVTPNKFIDFIQSANYLEFDIIGELLALPNVLSPKGIYYYILDKQISTIKKALEKNVIDEKYYILTLNLENDYMLTEDRDVVVLIKEGKYYFPIYKVKKIDKKITITRFYDKSESKIISELTNYYEKSSQNKLLNQITLSNELCCKNIIFNLEKNNIKIKKQIIDNRNKCKYIEVENDVLIPVKPSGIHYNYNFVVEDENIKLKKLSEIIDLITKIDKKINKNYIPKSVFYDSVKNGNVKIVSLLLYNELLIPIKPEYMSEKDIKKLGLSVKFQPLEIDINKEILKNNITIDNRTYNVKRRMFTSEAYNIYRLELSYFLENNESIRDNIITIVRNKKMNVDDKKNELRKILFDIIDKKIISNYGLSGGGKALTMAHVIKELPKLNEYIIYNVRDYCESNKNKNTCETNQHCSWNNESCKMQLTENLAIDYVNRIIEEMVQDSIKFKEIIQENNYYVSDIVDYTQFSFRPNQTIIKSSNFTINKIMSELFGKDKTPVIGKKQLLLKKSDFNDDNDYPELIEFGQQLRQPIENNNNSIIRAYVNCFYWVNNVLYDNISRNLGYTSELQTSITNLFKANIIDFIQNNQNDTFIKNYLKKNDNFFDTLLNKFRKSSLNTDCRMELYVLSHLIDLPIVVYDNYSNVKYIFLQGEVDVTNDTIKNFTKKEVLNKTIFIKLDYDTHNKIPKNIFSIYYK